jgi:hypothetical protein
VLEHTVDRVQPFLGFLRVDVRVHVHGIFLTVMSAMRVRSDLDLASDADAASLRCRPQSGFLRVSGEVSS